MIHVTRTLAVPHPLEKVMAYLADFAHAVDWDPGTVSCERLGEGAIGEGSRWHNVSEFRGRRTELTYRLDTYTPDRLVFSGVNKTAETSDGLTFAPGAGSTHITYRATIRFKGLATLASPFLRREFERLGDEITTTMPRAVTQALG
ncbi:SRPBCC family protein [Streptomyces sp. SPB074]|uniref:SRPBCC family protein n=1 Tax=Streptomyces sp. (strain SPB074) TaxID=465543 RepID=UPI0001D1DF76|nr:SRPBCC family protein [Streptomyces sp. SPB074]EFG65226.1 polyketide cyclase/dehydrase superfamily protein [Streptomyces sp. SPB074]